MALHKIAASFTDRQLAYRVGGALENIIEPAPEALTVFEAGPDRWRLEAYFDMTDAGSATPRDLGAELAAVMSDADVRNLPAFEPEDIPDVNWVAVSQAALPPVIAGRFTIHGSHDRGRVARGPNTILIDAGEAFGTAHHATTLGCLMAIDRLTRAIAFDTVLDLGCGSGVLAIAVARADPHARIIATDLDQRSVAVARENTAFNGVKSRITVAVAAGTDHPSIRRGAPFDLVIANILAGPLIRLAPDMARTVARGGTLILSGLLIPQAAQVIASYRAVGFVLDRHDRITGWSTLTLRRR